MTHMSNYGSDHLANYMWRSLVRFIRKWTNIQLKFRSPTELADLYFNLYPEEKTPIWQPPCASRLHKEVWNSLKPCYNLPNVLIIGPPESGTSVLHNWLAFHPLVSAGTNSTDFFTKHYMEGLDWYMQHFPALKADHFIVDSVETTHIDLNLVKRIHALLPKAKIIFLLEEPVRLALRLCEKNLLNEMAKSGHSTDCLEAGYYVDHLRILMQKYSFKQIFIANPQDFLKLPITLLGEIQKFLGVKKSLDYSELLRFDPERNHYCPMFKDNKALCNLKAQSDALKISEIDDTLAEYLQGKFLPYNELLRKLLQKFDLNVPNWLKQ
eukprot:m.191235 g.191235  ORF g.191235 m.191235 type:complete len:324 (+) comp39443_c0_seq1:54-1025(+)